MERWYRDYLLKRIAEEQAAQAVDEWWKNQIRVAVETARNAKPSQPKLLPDGGILWLGEYILTEHQYQTMIEAQQAGIFISIGGWVVGEPPHVVHDQNCSWLRKPSLDGLPTLAPPCN